MRDDRLLEALRRRRKEVFGESGYFQTITKSLHLRFPTDLADFGEGLAENGKAGPLEALRRRGKEVFCESGYSQTITWCPQLRFATDMADFGERTADAGSTLKESQRTLSTARSPPVSALTKETTSTRHTGASKRVDGTGRS